METLDYQNECSLINYPFQDGVSLIWTNASNNGTLPANIILDALVTATSLIQPYLNNIVYNGTTVIFNFSNSFSVTATNLGGINTFSYRLGDNLLRLDIDTDQLFSYLISLGLIGTFTFDSTNVLIPSCIKLLPPVITEISFYNTEQSVWTSSPSTSIVSSITSGGINLNEGANTKFTFDNNSTVIDILPNSGQGLFDDCPINQNLILTINNEPPNLVGNYFIGNDVCYSITPTSNGLTISNNCIADCTPDTFINLAHYLNRVTDASNQLVINIGETNTIFNNLASIITSKQSEPQIPYLLGQTNAYSNAIYNFNSITLGIYNPSPVPISINLSANFNNTDYSIQPNSFSLIIDNEKIVKPTPISSSLLTDFSLDCSSVTFVGLVLKSLLSIVNSGKQANDIVFNLSTSGCGLALSPTTFNYNYSYSISVGSSIKVITITLDLLDPNQPSNSDTTFNFNIPGYFSVVSGNLITNNTTANLLPSAFSNIAIDYSKNNSYTFTLSCPISITGSQSIPITAFNSLSSANKTITFTL